MHPRVRSLLAVVFFCSGATSLVFQVAWQRLLTVVYGVGTVTITTIVSVYVLGLGVGALVGGRVADRARDPLAAYLVVELGLGVFGFLSLPYLAFLGAHTMAGSYAVTLACTVLFLCIPTLAMGMTLPLLVRIFDDAGKRTPAAGSPLPNDGFRQSVAFLYFINTLGASCGALAGSYLLLSFVGIDRAIEAAAAVDLLLAAVIYSLRRRTGARAPQAAAPAPSTPRWLEPAQRLAFAAGFIAIAYEIVGSRLLQVLVKDSPYAFSTALSVYLAGIAIGSYGVAKYARRRSTIDDRKSFLWMQAFIGAYVIIVVTAFYWLTKGSALGRLTGSSFSVDRHPSWVLQPNASWADTVRASFVAVDIVIWPLLFFFPPALAMGASLPLLSSLAHTRTPDAGAAVGRVYLANTVGNVIGGLAVGFVLLPLVGSEATLFLLALAAAAMGLSLPSLRGRRITTPVRAAALALLGAAALVFPGEGQLYGAIHPAPAGWATYCNEGIDGVVVTKVKGSRVTNFVNGQLHGDRPGYWYIDEAVEALSYARRTEDVLVIGFGTGATAETVLAADGLRKLTVVEISKTLIDNLGRIDMFRQLLADPRMEIVLDDGRRHLARTAELYDVILIDSVRTSTAYSNNLHSAELFALVRAHLRDGGVFLLLSEENRVVPHTLASVFSRLRAYQHYYLASDAPFVKSGERERALLARMSPQVRAGLADSRSPYVGDEAWVRRVAAGYPINTDLRPVTEYFLGLEARRWLGLAPLH